ncbi:MAG: hypothetical protein ACREIC_18290, partial [Limisphaerales bacterium]
MFVFLDGNLNLEAHFFPDVVFHANQCIRHPRRRKRWNLPTPPQDMVRLHCATETPAHALVLASGLRRALGQHASRRCPTPGAALAVVVDVLV